MLYNYATLYNKHRVTVMCNSALSFVSVCTIIVRARSRPFMHVSASARVRHGYSLIDSLRRAGHRLASHWSNDVNTNQPMTSSQ